MTKEIDMFQLFVAKLVLVLLPAGIAIATPGGDNLYFVEQLGQTEVKRQLGEGHDFLTGGRKESCIDSAQISAWIDEKNQVEDTVDVIRNQEELADKLEIDINAKASGIAKIFSGGVSIGTTIIRETGFNNQTFVGLARYKWTKSGKEVYESLPPLTAEMESLLTEDPAEFRRRCGDGFTRRVEQGADLYLVIEAKEQRQTSRSYKNIDSTISLGFSKLFGLTASTNVSDEQKRVLDNYSFSTKCYSVGGDPDVCAKHNLSLSGMSVLESDFAQQVKQAKMAMADSAKRGEFLVALSQVKEAYSKPTRRAKEKYWDVFYDYRPRLVKLQNWLAKEGEVREICASNDYIISLCQSGRRAIASHLESCAVQDFWQDDECRYPNSDDFAGILTSGDLGFFELFQHKGFQGRKLKFNLNGIFSREARMQPQVLYNLHDRAYGPFHDLMTSYQVRLKRGWKLVFFEHINGTGKNLVIEGSGQLLKGHVPGWFNDRLSSFKIIRTESFY